MQSVLRPRLNLSEQIREIVRERILDGELSPDSRINEARLAEELDVSRTPVREALMGLVSEGALRSVPGRGVFVRTLSVDEFRHIYPIRSLLDPEALRLTGLPPPGRLARLEELNEQMRRENDAGERVRLDDAWHLELVADCPNPVLLDLIRQFMARTRRYELAFYRNERNRDISTEDHARVHAAAKARDLAGAIEALVANLTSGIEPILTWLERTYGHGTDSVEEAVRNEI